jgi:ABC-type sugar transport system ATPase subunit
VAQIEIKQLAKRFHNKGAPALECLDLTINSGELLVILGPSGSGKSTLLRLIAGLESPDAGTITLGGQGITNVAPHDRDMAMVFQHPALYPHLSVYENLAFGLRFRKIPHGQVRSRVNQVAGILGLDPLLSRRPAQLSGGERQRVAIGRAVVREPRVMLFDEPFSSLDLPLRSALRSEVLDIHRRLGTTLIHVTHDQSEALLMGDRIAVLDAGRLRQCGSPRQIYDHPQHRMVATFVGNPPMNLIPCKLEPEADLIRVTPLAVEHSASFLVPLSSVPFYKSTGISEIDMGLRPESIQLETNVPPDPNASSALEPTPTPTIPTRIRNIAYCGSETWATLSIGPHTLITRTRPEQALEPQQHVNAILDLRPVAWFDPKTGMALRVD